LFWVAGGEAVEEHLQNPHSFLIFAVSVALGLRVLRRTKKTTKAARRRLFFWRGFRSIGAGFASFQAICTTAAREIYV
jgi:hypothetical protein